jgi:hypothetical protein
MRQTAKGIAVLQRARALSPEDDALHRRLDELSGELHAEATDGTYLRRFPQRVPGDPHALELQRAVIAPNGS